MKKTFLLAVVALCISALSLNAQNDPKSTSILNALSAKTKTYTSIKADFTWTVERSDKTKTTEKGSIVTKGAKYKLSIPGHVIYSDGKAIWDFIADINEVQINDAEEEGEDALNPSTIFTIYEKGYKHKFDSEANGIQIINLYPLNPDKKKFHTIKLYINKAKKQISQVKILMNNGNKTTYAITKFTVNETIADSYFTFDAAKHPGVSVEDLR